MRKSPSNRSTKSKRNFTPFKDLITRSDAYIGSQATEADQTQRQERTINTLGTSTMKDHDQYQDVIREQFSTLFITPEEEQQIHNILELARKGKINATNAFQLPVKVINANAVQNSTMRFWKFASEMLNTSMNIYEKRVQNVFINTNKMVGNLTRINDKTQKNSFDDNALQKSTRRRNSSIHIDLGNMEIPLKLSNFQLKHINTEQPEKINIKQSKYCFIANPTFQKQLQVFHCNKLTSLFLNTLTCSHNLELELFSNQMHEIVIDIEKIELQQNQTIHTEINQYFTAYQVQKITYAPKNIQILSKIEKYRGDNIENAQQEDIFASYQDIIEEYQKFNALSINNQISEHLNIDSNLVSIIIQDNEKQNQIDIKQLLLSQQDCSNRQNHSSENIWNKSLLNKNQCLTMMTPWQMQRKGLKSRFIKAKRSINGSGNSTTFLNKSKEDIQIQFTFQRNQNRRNIFERRDQLFSYKQNKIIVDQYLAPKTMNPFVEIAKKYRQNKNSKMNIDEIQHSFLQISQNHIKANYQNFLSNVERVKKQSPDVSPNATSIYQHHFQFSESIVTQIPHEEHIQTEELRDLKTFGLKNVRQIKQTIFEELCRKKRLAISDIVIPISPAGILIIFLHLASQKNLFVKEINQEADIQISFKQQWQ